MPVAPRRPPSRLLVALSLTPAVVLPAQGREPRVLPDAAIEFAAPLSSLGALVELPGGRVLVHDPIERKLGVLDPRSDAIREVARPGGGPLEYRSVGALLRLPGDSVAVWDPTNARLLLLAPDGAPRATERLEARAPGLAASRGAAPRVVDDAGTWYAVIRPAATGDTTTLVRAAAASPRLDTLARFATPQLRPRRTAEGIVKVRAPGFAPPSAWAAFRDGRVLLLHGETYTPELVPPRGRPVRGASIAYDRVPVTAADREAHLAETAAAMERMLGRELQGRGGVMPRVVAEPPEAWPATLPPIGSDTVFVDSRARAWVRRSGPSSRTQERYDLLDGDGRRVDAIRLPRGARLVAMGEGVLYTAREDADGLVRLRRHPLP